MATTQEPPGEAPGRGRVDVPALYAEHWLGLVRLAALLVGDRAAAEDVVQDAFVQLHRRAGTVRDPQAALGYLRTSVVNGARSALRRRATARRHLPRLVSRDDPPADERVLAGEEQRAAWRALDALPARRRETLLLRYWGDLTDAEIAEAMGVSVTTVRSAASRGTAELRAALEETR